MKKTGIHAETAIRQKRAKNSDKNRTNHKITSTDGVLQLAKCQIPTKERESPGSHEDAPVHGDVAVGEGELAPRLHQVVHLGGHHRVLEELQYWHCKQRLKNEDTDTDVFG